MLKDMLLQISNLKTKHRNNYDVSEALLQGVKSKVYKPLMERQTCGKVQRNAI